MSLFTYLLVPLGLQSCSPAMCDQADALLLPPQKALRCDKSTSWRFDELSRSPHRALTHLEPECKPAPFWPPAAAAVSPVAWSMKSSEHGLAPLSRPRGDTENVPAMWGYDVRVLGAL